MSIKKVLCIHHYDMDGYASAMAARTSKMLSKLPFEFLSANYDMEFDFSKINKDYLVLIVDFSLPVQYFDELVDKVGLDRIIWIDHHLSSINKYRDYPATINGLQFNGLAACELCYLYFHHTTYQKSRDILVVNGKEYDLEGLLVFLKNTKDIPACVKAAGRFDVWRFTTYEEYIQNLMFNDGFSSIMPKPQNEVGEEWKAFFSLDDTKQAKAILDAGAPIMEYKTSNFASQLKRLGFQCRIRKFDDVHAIAVNTAEKGSFIFETVKNNYEVGIVFALNAKGKMEYSIYRLGENPEKTIMVNKIAESFGGGGHASASGWVTNGTLVVEKV